MSVKPLLKAKGAKIFSIGPEDTLYEAMKILNDQRIGALLVLEKGQLKGIISERDVLHVAFKMCGDICEMKVAKVMTPAKKLVTGTVSHSILEVMDLMTQHKIRHLPILDGKKVVGIVSIGDVVKALHDETVAENDRMREYITGSAG